MLDPLNVQNVPYGGRFWIDLVLLRNGTDSDHICFCRLITTENYAGPIVSIKLIMARKTVVWNCQIKLFIKAALIAI